MQKRVTNHVGRNFFSSAQHQRIVIAKISDVGDPPYQGLDDNCKCTRPGRFEDFTQICRRDENNLRKRVMKPLDFAVINRLDLPPKLPDFLFLIVARKDFAESFERNDFRRQFIAPQNWLKRRRRSGHQAKPQIPRKSRTGIPQFVVVIEFPHGVHRGTLLLAQALSHLRAERRPIVGADVRFKTGCDQRAHGCEHRFAAVNTQGAGRSGPCARPRGGRLGRWRSW